MQIEQAGMHNLSPLQPPADPTQQLPSPINMPKADPRRGREHLPTASSHMLQQKGSSDAACIVHQQLAESAEGNNCYCSWVKGATCTPSPHFTRHTNPGTAPPACPTQASQQQHKLQAQHKVVCSSTGYHPALVSVLHHSSAASAPAPSHTPAAALPMPQPLGSSTSIQQLNDGPLLPRLQQLTSSLAEAVRVKDLQRMQVVLQLLHSVPVTGQLLLSSQAAVVVRQMLEQGYPQQADLRMQQAASVQQLAAAVVQSSEQLLDHWRAVIKAEVAAADSTSLQHAREALHQLPCAGQLLGTAASEQLTQPGTSTRRQSRRQQSRQQQRQSADMAADHAGEQQRSGKRQQQAAGRTADGRAHATKKQRISKRKGNQGRQALPATAAAARSSTWKRQQQQGLSSADTSFGRLQFSWPAASVHFKPATAAAGSAAVLQDCQISDQGPSAAAPSTRSISPVVNCSTTVGRSSITVIPGARAGHRTATRAAARKSKPGSSGDNTAADPPAALDAAQAAALPVANGDALAQTWSSLAAAAAETHSNPPGAGVKLAVGTTMLAPTGTGTSADSTDQQSKAATAAAEAAGRGSAMWGAGAKALRAVKGPSYHHHRHHSHQQQQHRRLYDSQQNNGSYESSAGAAADAAIVHALTPSRFVTCITRTPSLVTTGVAAQGSGGLALPATADAAAAEATAAAASYGSVPAGTALLWSDKRDIQQTPAAHKVGAAAGGGAAGTARLHSAGYSGAADADDPCADEQLLVDTRHRGCSLAGLNGWVLGPALQ